MRVLLCIAAAFCLFAAIPSSSDARGHGGGRGERRIGQRLKSVLHPLQRLKERRAEKRG